MSYTIPAFELDINVAYNKDAAGNEYFGWAPRIKGVSTAKPHWKIIKMHYTSGNWVKKYADGNALFDNIWDNVESLSYRLLEE